MGRIYAFLDNNTEAAKEFDEAIKIGKVTEGAPTGMRLKANGNWAPPKLGKQGKGERVKGQEAPTMTKKKVAGLFSRYPFSLFPLLPRLP